MDSMTLIAMASIVTAGLTTGFGTIGPALANPFWNHVLAQAIGK
jgi:hypothetical protein